MAGCANIPMNGGVSKLTIDAGGGEAAPVTLPDGPTKGESQQQILEGFIKAGRGPQLNYEVARDFLSDAFRSKWNPNAGALISSSPIESAPIGDNQLQIAVGVSAEVDSTGRYTEYAESQSKPLQFRFQKDAKGQWRISSAPDGTVLTPNRFSIDLPRLRPILLRPHFPIPGARQALVRRLDAGGQPHRERPAGRTVRRAQWSRRLSVPHRHGL